MLVLETFNKHKNKTKVKSILRKYGSVKDLIKRCFSELDVFEKRLQESELCVKDFQVSLLDVDELVCFKCEGKGYTNKTRYVRERGQSPQPFIEAVYCKACDGTGKILTKNIRFN